MGLFAIKLRLKYPQFFLQTGLNIVLYLVYGTYWYFFTDTELELESPNLCSQCVLIFFNWYVTNRVRTFTASNGYPPGEFERCRTDCFYSTIYNKKIEHMASKIK